MRPQRVQSFCSAAAQMCPAYITCVCVCVCVCDLGSWSSGVSCVCNEEWLKMKLARVCVCVRVCVFVWVLGSLGRLLCPVLMMKLADLMEIDWKVLINIQVFLDCIVTWTLAHTYILIRISAGILTSQISQHNNCPVDGLWLYIVYLYCNILFCLYCTWSVKFVYLYFFKLLYSNCIRYFLNCVWCTQSILFYLLFILILLFKCIFVRHMIYVYLLFVLVLLFIIIFKCVWSVYFYLTLSVLIILLICSTFVCVFFCAAHVLSM